MTLLVIAFILWGPVSHGAPNSILRGKLQLNWNTSITDQDRNRYGVDASIVYVTGFSYPPPGESVTIFEKGSSFSPHVLPVTAGQRIEFFNDDVIAHNAFSNSQARMFDLGLKDPGKRDSLRLEKTGIVSVYCNIHPEMAMTILVLPNRAFARVAKDGSYSISGIPAGQYKVFAWHPLAGAQSQELKFEPGKQTDARWTLEVEKGASKHLDKKGRPYRSQPRGY